MLAATRRSIRSAPRRPRRGEQHLLLREQFLADGVGVCGDRARQRGRRSCGRQRPDELGDEMAWRPWSRACEQPESECRDGPTPPCRSAPGSEIGLGDLQHHEVALQGLRERIALHAAARVEGSRTAWTEQRGESESGARRGDARAAISTVCVRATQCRALRAA